MIKEEIRGIYMNKKKFFLLPICLLLLGACNNAHASSTPVEDSNVTSQSAVDPDHKHVYGDWVQTKAPTCTEKGEEEQVCACGDKKTRTVNALGHDWGEWTVKTAATCTVDGVEERDVNEQVVMKKKQAYPSCFVLIRMLKRILMNIFKHHVWNRSLGLISMTPQQLKKLYGLPIIVDTLSY